MYWLAPAADRPAISDPLLKYMETHTTPGGCACRLLHPLPCGSYSSPSGHPSRVFADTLSSSHCRVQTTAARSAACG